MCRYAQTLVTPVMCDSSCKVKNKNNVDLDLNKCIFSLPQGFVAIKKVL